MSVPLISLNDGNKIPALGFGQPTSNSYAEYADRLNSGSLGISVGLVQVLGNSSLMGLPSIPLHMR